MSDRDIRVRTWVRGSADDERVGLLGYLSILYGNLILDNGVLNLRTYAGYELSISTVA